MLVSEWATKYWEISTVTKKTLYDYKSVFGRVISPHFGHLDLDAVAKPSKVSSDVFVTSIFAVMFPTETKLASSSFSYLRILQERKSSAAGG
jgi:hypothetical protein